MFGSAWALMESELAATLHASTAKIFDKEWDEAHQAVVFRNMPEVTPTVLLQSCQGQGWPKMGWGTGSWVMAASLHACTCEHPNLWWQVRGILYVSTLASGIMEAMAALESAMLAAVQPMAACSAAAKTVGTTSDNLPQEEARAVGLELSAVLQEERPHLVSSVHRLAGLLGVDACGISWWAFEVSVAAITLYLLLDTMACHRWDDVCKTQAAAEAQHAGVPPPQQ